MTTDEKEIIFKAYYRAECDKANADPYDDRDNLYYGAYNAIDDLVADLGLMSEYNEWKERNNKQ